jgi:hypothetical protein
MFRTVRLMIRLGVLVLAGYGAKALYEKYADQAPELRARSRELLRRTEDTVTETAQRVSVAARDMTEEIKDAANDAAADARNIRDDVVGGTDVDPAPSRFSGAHSAN